LYIDNSNTTTPLIYGEFDNDKLTVNGDLIIAGNVTQQGGISFLAYNSVSDNNFAGTDQVEFDMEEHDDGNNFSSDQFTAPSDGLYHFSVNVNVDGMSTVSAVVIYLRVDGTNKLNLAYRKPNTTYDSFNGSATLKLSKDAVVSIWISHGGGDIYGNVGTRWTYFSGYRVH
ncbi:MAG TPA: hypothetical protein EYQ86_03620, partial [Bacteroidetes bacterium]|nr:hypothetical protein [Bacteroidota bacterium]